MGAIDDPLLRFVDADGSPASYVAVSDGRAPSPLARPTDAAGNVHWPAQWPITGARKLADGTYQVGPSTDATPLVVTDGPRLRVAQVSAFPGLPWLEPGDELVNWGGVLVEGWSAERLRSWLRMRNIDEAKVEVFRGGVPTSVVYAAPGRCVSSDLDPEYPERTRCSALPASTFAPLPSAAPDSAGLIGRWTEEDPRSQRLEAAAALVKRLDEQNAWDSAAMWEATDNPLVLADALELHRAAGSGREVQPALLPPRSSLEIVAVGKGWAAHLGDAVGRVQPDATGATVDFTRQAGDHGWTLWLAAADTLLARDAGGSYHIFRR